MFVPLPTKVGQTQDLKGDFTKAMYFRSQPAAEVERRVGYRAGRLREGYWLMFLQQMPSAEQFEFGGYSQLSGGIELGHLPQNVGKPTAEDRLRSDGFDLPKLKRKIIAGHFLLMGAGRLAKIRPVAPAHGGKDEPDYPPGSGIPQWTLKVPLRWVAAAFIGPGEVYLGNYA